MQLQQNSEFYTLPAGEVKASELVPQGNKIFGLQIRLLYKCPCKLDSHFGVRVFDGGIPSPFIYCPYSHFKWLIVEDSTEIINADLCVMGRVRSGITFGVPIDYRPVQQ